MPSLGSTSQQCEYSSFMTEVVICKAWHCRKVEHVEDLNSKFAQAIVLQETYCLWNSGLLWPTGTQICRRHNSRDSRQKEGRTTSAWVKCLWGWDGYWKAKKHKSPGIDQITAELFKAWRRTIRSEVRKLIRFKIRKNWLRSGRIGSLYLSIRRAIKETVVVIGEYHVCQLHTKCYPTSCFQG